MIKKRSSVLFVTIGMLGMILLGGCGAGTGNDVPPPEPGQTVAASIDLLVSNPQLDSQQPTQTVPAPTVTLTAIVKDSSNRALAEKEVSFTADSGLLAVTSGTTDANGQATATLSAGGNPTNRVINLTAASGSVNTANSVAVTGTNLSISGASSLSFGDTTPLTIFLKDSAGAGIPRKSVTVTSLNGNTLSPATALTNDSGQVTVNFTATAGGTDKITASAIGATKEFELLVNTSILTFITPSPTAITEIPIETNRSVTVEYISGTTPQAGVAIDFSTTRGTLSSSTATTGADGRATVSIASTYSGRGEISARAAGGPTASAGVEFVSTTPRSLTLQASPATIGTNSGGVDTERSTITATVRDANNNLVKNKEVIFNIASDVSGGRLTPGSATTDSFGAASTVFIAGASSGGLGGVTIRATVVGTTVTATTTLTVAKKALFISLATGPTIIKVDPNKYQQDYVALVTDSAGNPVVGATVVATVTPVYYQKGYYIFPTGATAWQQVVTLQAASSTLPGIPACANEDGMLHDPLYDFNGILDTNPSTGAKEDQNGNNRLDPGNVASVTPATTGSDGHATVSVVYARDYAHWVNVQLEAFANDLKGSTASASAIFTLPGLASDYTSPTASPPGNPSPFGTSISCYVDLTVTPVSASQMALTWQKSATASYYRVFRNGINIAVPTQTTYFDTGLSSGTQYCYQIRTVDATGAESAFTNTVCNSTFVLPPSGPSVTALSASQIRISWTASPGASGYRVYRNSGTLPLTTVVSTSTVDSGLTANTSYCYAVSSFNAAGESAQSSQVCATTRSAGPPVPELTAEGSTDPPPRITLTWVTSLGATSYRIFRNGTFLLSSTGAQAIDTAVAEQTQYCYTISAVDAAGNESAQSDPQCASASTVTPPPQPPATPTGLAATVVAGPAVELIWSLSTGAVSYNIYRNGFFLQSSTAPPVVDNGPFGATTLYCYSISAVNAAGAESARSAAPECERPNP